MITLVILYKNVQCSTWNIDLLTIKNITFKIPKDIWNKSNDLILNSILLITSARLSLLSLFSKEIYLSRIFKLFLIL